MNNENYNTSLNEIVWPRLIERRYLKFFVLFVVITVLLADMSSFLRSGFGDPKVPPSASKVQFTAAPVPGEFDSMIGGWLE